MEVDIDWPLGDLGFSSLLDVDNSESDAEEGVELQGKVTMQTNKKQVAQKTSAPATKASAATKKANKEKGVAIAVRLRQTLRREEQGCSAAVSSSKRVAAHSPSIVR